MLAAVVASALLAATLPTEQVDPDSIRSLITSPVLTTGGVLMAPLVADRGGDRWPSHVELQLDDGRSTTGHIGWLWRSTAPPSSWTHPPGRLTIRPIAPDDRWTPGTTIPGPFLLAWLPEAYQGDLLINGQLITPRWMNQVDLPRSSMHRQTDDEGRLDSRPTPDRPDPTDPLAYWRWTLLAHRSGMDPPPPPQGSTVETLGALHGAQQWSIGLARLAHASPGVAMECVELLSMTTRIDDLEIAAWVTDPTRLNDLLSLLLDESVDEDALVRRVLQWCDAAQQVLTWFENPLGITAIRWRLANAGVRPTVATIVWSSPDDVPLAVEVSGSASLLTEVLRPSPAGESPDGARTVFPSGATATVALGPHTHYLHAPAPVVTAVPPSVTIGPLLPPLTLDEVRHRRRGVVSRETATVVHLRKAHGRWELFATCYRPTEDRLDGETMPMVGLIPESVRGHEAISFILRVTTEDGTPTGPRVTVTIPEVGPVRGNDRAQAAIHRRSLAESWVARVELPWQWLPPDGSLLSLAVARTHAHSLAIETGPVACLPWHLDPGPIHIDLSRWDEIDRIPLLNIDPGGL